MSAERVLATLAQMTGRQPDQVRPEQDLAADLELDSAQGMELLATLEDELGIEISEVEAARLRTVGEVIELVNRKTGS